MCVMCVHIKCRHTLFFCFFLFFVVVFFQCMSEEAGRESGRGCLPGLHSEKEMRRRNRQGGSGEIESAVKRWAFY